MTDISTATAAFLDRYKAREVCAGETGQLFKLKPLRPSDIFHLRDMLKDCDDQTFNAMCGIASICEQCGDKFGVGTDWFPIVFPKNRGDLDQIMNRVGFNALPALMKAFNKVNGGTDASEELEAEADAA